MGLGEESVLMLAREDERKTSGISKSIFDSAERLGSLPRQFYQTGFFLYGVHDYFSAKASAFEKLIFYFERQPEDSRQA